MYIVCLTPRICQEFWQALHTMKCYSNHQLTSLENKIWFMPSEVLPQSYSTLRRYAAGHVHWHKERQISTSLPNKFHQDRKENLLWGFQENCLQDTQVSPEEVRWQHLAHSGSQSQCRMWYIWSYPYNKSIYKLVCRRPNLKWVSGIKWDGMHSPVHIHVHVYCLFSLPLQYSAVQSTSESKSFA